MLVVVVHLAVGVRPRRAAGKVPWIGYLAGAGSGPSPAFIQGLRDLGYVEARTLPLCVRTTEGKNERYSDRRRMSVQRRYHRGGGKLRYPRCQESDKHNPHRHVKCWRPCRIGPSRQPRAT